MNHRISILSLITLGLTGLHTPPASAQSNTQDVQIYAGYLFGDRLLEEPLSGGTPRLDDSATYGARYTYHFADQFGVQLSAGYSPSRAAHVASGDSNLGLTTVDIDLQFDVLPNFQLAGHQFVPYTVVGVGYAWANVDTMSGLIGAKPGTISGSNGYTANVGFGAKYFLTSSLFVDVDARYRYMNRLVSDFGQGLNTSETTVGVGYRF
jgi:opacity protein-like surface antigen